MHTVKCFTSENVLRTFKMNAEPFIFRIFLGIFTLPNNLSAVGIFYLNIFIKYSLPVGKTLLIVHRVHKNIISLSVGKMLSASLLCQFNKYRMINQKLNWLELFENISFKSGRRSKQKRAYFHVCQSHSKGRVDFETNQYIP